MDYKHQPKRLNWFTRKTGIQLEVALVVVFVFCLGITLLVEQCTEAPSVRSTPADAGIITSYN